MRRFTNEEINLLQDPSICGSVARPMISDNVTCDADIADADRARAERWLELRARIKEEQNER